MSGVPRSLIFQMAGGGGGIDLPSTADLPDVDTDAGALLEAADDLSRSGTRLRSRSEDAASTWGNLPAVYTAGGTESLYGTYQPIVTHADGIATTLIKAADALQDFALKVGGFRFDHQDLTGRINSLRVRYYETEADSPERLILASQAIELNGEVAAFRARVEIAEQTCADILAGIGGGTVRGVTPTAAAASGSYAGALDAAVSHSTMEQLEALAQMTPEAARAWIGAHPEFVEALMVSPPPPEQISVWWATLGPPVAGRDGTKDPNALQLALIESMPEVLGNLNGVPYWGRNDANELVLAREIDEARRDLDTWLSMPPSTTTPEENFGTILQRYEALLAIHEAMNNSRSGYGRSFYQLTELHMDQHPPLAAISSGDLDEATNVTFVVPGMNTTVESGMVGMVENADALYLAQLNQLTAEGSQETTAIVSWIGYETPGYFSVFGNDHAYNGADRLGDTLSGYNGTGTNGTHLNLIMHSYGGTTGTWELARHDHGVDDAVLLNSPGVIPDSADDLHAGDVWAATPPDDFVVEVGNAQWGHPHLPKDPEFGANWFDVPKTEAGGFGPHGLEHHFVDGEGQPYGSSSESPGEALQQLVDITLGNDGDVEMEDPQEWHYERFEQTYELNSRPH